MQKQKPLQIKTTPTEQLPQYNEILANVASVKNQEQQEMPETKPTLTIEEEQRQRTEKYAAEQNAKRDEFAERSHWPYQPRTWKEWVK